MLSSTNSSVDLFPEIPVLPYCRDTHALLIFPVMSKGQNVSNPRRVSQIKTELADLFKAQTQFFKRGTRARHTDDDIEEYEQRREQIRQLFAELEDLQKVA